MKQGGEGDRLVVLHLQSISKGGNKLSHKTNSLSSVTCCPSLVFGVAVTKVAAGLLETAWFFTI